MTGKWIVVPLVVVTGVVGMVFLGIQLSGRGAAETNYLILSYTAGLRDLDEGYYVDAVKNLTPVVEVGENASAYGWRGEAYLRMEKYVEAEADLREAVRVEPGTAANHAGLGEALAAQGEFAESLPHFDRAVELLRRTDAVGPGQVRRTGDTLSDVLEGRAEVLDALGRSEEAGVEQSAVNGK